MKKLAVAATLLLSFAMPALAQPGPIPIPIDEPEPPGPGGGPPATDTTPPATIGNLSVLSTTQTSATLQWTAPGDDGASGTATLYDLRYSTAGPITLSNWDSATPAAGEPAPAPAGSVQSMTLTGLSAGTTCWFAMRTADEVSNWSGLSNSPSGSTVPAPDVSAPATITDLAVSAVSTVWIGFTWTAPGDDGMAGTAQAYDVRWSASPITNDADFQAATPVAWGIPLPAPGGTTQNGAAGNLATSTTYWIAMKTRDEVNNWSAMSNVVTATTTFPSAPESRKSRACGGHAGADGSLHALTLAVLLIGALVARRR